jgi:glycosyltransferase involved in cell wall biosynthesis
LKLLYLITEDWFFCSHFIERAIAAKAAGHEILVVTQRGAKGAQILKAGLRLIHVPLVRRSLNPLSAAWAVLCLIQIYSRERPDLVHHIAMKPIFLGTLVARVVGVRGVVNAPVGMGFVYTSKGLLARLLRPLFWVLMHTLLNPRGSKVILENTDDCAALIKNHYVRETDIRLIRGAGVDIDEFRPSERTHDGIVVMLVARLLWDKGVGEYVEAARLLRVNNPQVRFMLVGSPDSQNPANIPQEQLDSWRAQGDVELWGHKENMPEVWAQADIACLPSYREGLPKALIEALTACWFLPARLSL